MRILYIKYATWKAIVQANSFTVYEQPTADDSAHVWSGTLDVVYRSDVRPTDFADYDAAFPDGPGRVDVPDEDEALANIIGLAVLLDPRTADGTPQVAQRDWRLGQAEFLRTDDGSAPLHVNGLPAGSVTVLWNGTGASDTGGDWTHSDDGTETVAAMRTGTNGLDSGVRSNNDKSTFTDPAGLTDIDAAWDSISFWMNPQVKETNTTLSIRFFDGTGAIGAKLDVAGYVPNFDIGVWQKVTIPIADFNLGGVQTDVWKFIYEAQGPKDQHYFFDDIELHPIGAGGGPFIFRVAAPTTEIYHVGSICIVIAASDTGWDSSAFASIAGGLTNGLLLRHRDIDAPSDFWTITMRDNVDLYGRLTEINAVDFPGATRMSTFLLVPKPASIVVTDTNVLDILVRDDLSGLSNMRAFVHYGVEDIPA